MPIPIRFVVTTYNLWGENRWPQREPALRDFLQLQKPDILCLQEFRQQTKDVLDQQLPEHSRVEDDFAGWTREGNIYWNDNIFKIIKYGAEKIGMEGPDPKTTRRMFWARLQIKEINKTIVIATAHYTYQNHKIERETGQSPRIEQAQKTIEKLKNISPEKNNEPVIFMGDLNDPTTGMHTLRDGGLTDSWEALGMLPQVTFPATPTARNKNSRPPKSNQVLDWQLHRGDIRPLMCHASDFYYEDLAPSDHKPLTVTYKIG